MVWLIPLGTGCWPRCGGYDIEGTTTTDYEDNTYNGHWFELCGANMARGTSWG